MKNVKISNTEQKVIEIIAQISKRKPDQIRMKDSLLNDIQLDSFHILELLSMLEEQFDFEAETDDLQPGLFRSVTSVVQFVRKRAGQ